MNSKETDKLRNERAVYIKSHYLLYIILGLPNTLNKTVQYKILMLAG